MAEVKITIKLIMDIPKNWHLVKHSDDKILMDMGDDKFLDVAFTPMLAVKKKGQSALVSSYDESFAKEILGMIKTHKSKMERMS